MKNNSAPTQAPATPDLEQTDRVITAASIANDAGLAPSSVQRIGRIAAKLGLHEDSRHSRKFPRLRVYSEHAEGLILHEIATLIAGSDVIDRGPRIDLKRDEVEVPEPEPYYPVSDGLLDRLMELEPLPNHRKPPVQYKRTDLNACDLCGAYGPCRSCHRRAGDS